MLVKNLIRTFKQLKDLIPSRVNYFTPSRFNETNEVINKLIKVLVQERDESAFLDEYANLSKTHPLGLYAAMDMIFEKLEISTPEQFELAMSV